MPWGTGHAVGYWAHDAGPGLNRRETRALAVGHVFMVIAVDPYALRSNAALTRLAPTSFRCAPGATHS